MHFYLVPNAVTQMFQEMSLTFTMCHEPNSILSYPISYSIFHLKKC